MSGSQVSPPRVGMPPSEDLLEGAWVIELGKVRWAAGACGKPGHMCPLYWAGASQPYATEWYGHLGSQASRLSVEAPNCILHLLIFKDVDP